MAFWGNHVVLGADRAGYYSTAPLEKTLLELVDFSLVNRCKPRLTVGAAHVRTSQMRYFDGRETEIGVKHILASGALPPALPGGAHRRRAVLGRRHSLQHADRGDLRRQSAPQLADLRRAHVESRGPRAGDDVGGHASPEGHPVFQPCRQPHRPPDADPSPAPRHQGTCSRTFPRTCATANGCASWRAGAASRACMSCGCWRRASTTRTTPRTSTSVRPASASAGKRATPTRRRALEQAPWQGEFDPLEGVILHEQPMDAAAG